MNAKILIPFIEILSLSRRTVMLTGASRARRIKPRNVSDLQSSRGVLLHLLLLLWMRALWRGEAADLRISS
jgi:hypothetical protein